MIFWLKSAYSDTTEETISGNYATNPTSTMETTTEPTDATTQTTTISEVEASYIAQIEEWEEPLTTLEQTFDGNSDINAGNPDIDIDNISIDGRMITFPATRDMIEETFGGLIRYEEDLLAENTYITDELDRGSILFQFDENNICTRMTVNGISFNGNPNLTIALPGEVGFGSPAGDIIDAIDIVPSQNIGDTDYFCLKYEYINRGIRVTFIGSSLGLESVIYEVM